MQKHNEFDGLNKNLDVFEDDIDDLDDLDEDDIHTEDEEHVNEGANYLHEAPLISADEVDVQIKCEIGKVNITLDELMKLHIGSVIDIVKWPSMVKLSVNGTHFAEGYLVEVNNMLGVKITKRLSNI